MLGSATGRKQVLFYLAAIVASVLTLLLRVALVRLFGELFPSQHFGELPRYLFFIPTVLLVAMLVDVWAGLLATATSALLIIYWVLPPKGQLNIDQPADVIGLILFCLSGAGVSLFAGLYHRHRRRLLEQHQNELAILETQRKNEEQFRTLANAIPQLCWMANPDGSIFWYNDRCYQYTGGTPEQMEGWGWQSLHDPEVLPKVLEVWKRAIDTEEPTEFVFPLRGADGLFRPFLTRVIPLKDSNGKLVRWFGTNTDVSELLATQKALRDSEERFRALVTATSDVVCSMSSDWSEMLELQGKDFLADTTSPSRTWLQKYVYPDDQSQVMEVINEAIRTKSKFEIEHRVVRADGSVGWTSSRCVPLFNDNGEVVEWFGTASDVTEHKRMQEALRESEARFRLFMDNSPAIAWMKDAHGKYVYLNRAFETRLGVRPEDCLNKTDAELWPEDIARRFRENDLLVLTENRPVHGVEEALAADGNRSTSLITKFPFSTVNGERFVAGIGMDITERRRAEEMWRNLSALVESSYDAIIGKTLDGTITSWNPGAERLYGYSAAEMLGQSISVLLPPGSPDDVSDILRRVANREFIENHETIRRRKDGSLVEVSLRISPILGSSGNVVGASTIAHDITERKRAQEAFLRSEKLAATGRLAATIAHEVNNPLAAAMNAVYIANTNPAQANEMLKLADQELRRAAHITEQTLGFYRESSSKQQVTVPRLVEEVLTVYATKLQNRNITVRRRYRCDSHAQRGGCPDGCKRCERYLLVSAGELRQIISSLLANGIDALADRGMMHIRVSRLSDRLQLTMADNGCGIRTEHLKRIFEPFFTTKEAFGTGLGLWVTRELVRKHDGAIKVRSRANKYTVFRLTFPQKVASSGDVDAATAASFTKVA
jgi:PAS domain S-box-containing protein